MTSKPDYKTTPNSFRIYLISAVKNKPRNDISKKKRPLLRSKAVEKNNHEGKPDQNFGTAVCFT